MNYPFWDVPNLGSGWIIGLIAIYHVMISHFAVGGGFYLPMAEAKLLKEGRHDWLPVIQKHSKFFLVLTGVFGAVSGVGIWFAIGLAHPEATSTLIHNFVFGWAIEWVFFIVELTTAAVYYYTWSKIPDRLHVRIGWLYAGASLSTLVIINGILTFMLTPGSGWLGVAGTGAEASKFWHAFFNPTYWPSLVMRILVCTSLAGVWALVTTSRIDGVKQPELKASLVRWSVKWLVPSFLLLPFAMVWFLVSVPETQRALLTLGISTIGSGTFTQVTRAGLVIVMSSFTIVGVAYFLAYRSPQDFSFSHAIAVLFLALCATASGEYSRELLRKPYVIGQHMYSNGVRVQQASAVNRNGYLGASPWQEGSGWGRGEAMFRGQCGSCHTMTGYRSMQRLLAGRNRESIQNLLSMLHEYKADSPYRRFMPPLVGSEAEIRALGDYLHGTMMALDRRSGEKKQDTAQGAAGGSVALAAH